MELPTRSGIVTLLTDSGLWDPYAGTLKGMVKRTHARAEVIDLCHEVPARNVQLGAFYLASAADRFPPGTVHLAIVDPGEESPRRVLAACAASAFWIGPDNGVLSEVLRRAPEPEVREVDLDRVRVRPGPPGFLGRDVYAPLAGMLSSGSVGFRALGPRVRDPAALPSLTDGSSRVVHVDPLGNLVTNLAPEPGLRSLIVAGRTIPMAGSREDAREDGLVARANTYDLLEISARDGGAAAVLGVRAGEPVERGGG